MVTWEDDSARRRRRDGRQQRRAVKAQVFAAGGDARRLRAPGQHRDGGQPSTSTDHGAVERRLRGDVAGRQPGRRRRDGGQQRRRRQGAGVRGGRDARRARSSWSTPRRRTLRSAQQITALSNGGFVVTWQDDSHGVGGATGDSSGTAVKAQVFAADGTRVGSELLVNTATARHQSNSADHGAVERRLRGDVGRTSAWRWRSDRGQQRHRP